MGRVHKGSRRSLSGPARAGRPASAGNRSAEGRRVKSCFACSPTGGLNWDATTVSKIAQTKWPTNRINTFAYANRAAPRRARKQRKLLAAKTFTYANTAFACANPGRGDVSPLQPARSAVFPALGLARGFYRIFPTVNWTSVFAPAVRRAGRSHTYRLHRDPA